MKRLIVPRCSALTESCRAAFGAWGPRPPGPPPCPGIRFQPYFDNCFSRHILSTLHQATTANSWKRSEISLRCECESCGRDGGCLTRRRVSVCFHKGSSAIQRPIISAGKLLLLEEAPFRGAFRPTAATTTSIPSLHLLLPLFPSP